MERPSVKIAGIVPQAAPAAPPARRPVKPPPAPATTAPPAADAAVTCTLGSCAALRASACKSVAFDLVVRAALAVVSATAAAAPAAFVWTDSAASMALTFMKLVVSKAFVLAHAAVSRARCETWRTPASISTWYTHPAPPTAPPPARPSSAPSVAPVPMPMPLPTAAPIGTERPKVKSAGATPAAVPMAAPLARPIAPPATPTTTAPLTEERTTTCVVGSLAI
mmetsp:Transcript_96526/g.249596  ORF Transcript_96526/g.249596 Transcript_96526/m.249596 type:complete len:223 (-) Transcript_96526:318-986(-)